MHAYNELEVQEAIDEHHARVARKYVPPSMPEGYPYGADAATKRAFLVSTAPPLTDAMRAHLRQLLMPRDVVCPVCSQHVERDAARGVAVAHSDRAGNVCPMSGQPITGGR